MHKLYMSTHTCVYNCLYIYLQLHFWLCVHVGYRSGSTETMEAYSPPSVDRKWLWVYYNKIPICPMFYLLERDYHCRAQGLDMGGDAAW